MNVAFGKGPTELTGPIVDGRGIRQLFTAAHDHLLSVSILFSTYCRQNPGTITIEVTDSAGKPIASDSVEAPKLGDNKYQRFELDAHLNKGKAYELRIRTLHCRSGQAATAHYAGAMNQGHLFVGARLVRDRELVCKFTYEGEPEVKEAAPVQGLPSGGIPGLVSVVIPHYECYGLLPKCLVSLSKQTYNSMEIIVVDDGSHKPGKIAVLMDAYKPLIPGLEFVSLGSNHGASHARNEGAKRAHGEYLFFADADCEFYPRMLEQMVKALIANPDIHFAYGGFRWGDQIVKARHFDAEVLKRKNYVTTMSLMRSSVFPGFDESLKRHQDWDLWLTIVDKGGRGMCVGEVMFETPRRSGSISSNENLSLKESMSIVRRKHAL